MASQTEVTIKLPQVFVEHLGPEYMERFLERAADIYKSWDDDTIQPSIFSAVRELSTVLTTCTEDLSSVTDTSPQEAMFCRATSQSCYDELLDAATDMIFDLYQTTLDEDDDETEMKRVRGLIETYINDTPNCFYDTFYGHHMTDFIKQMGWKTR